MREIVNYPNKILRQKTLMITEVDKKLLKDIADLKEVLLSHKHHAAGLAAPQIGLNRRFFGLLTKKKDEVKIYINPKIEAAYGERVKPVMIFEDGKEETFLEGCLSFPDLFGVVKRFLKLEGSWEEIEKGKLVRKKGKLEGIEAIAFQHESEHLDGILFVDHIKTEGGELYKWIGENKVVWSVDKVIKA
jgi:peptide deformylase